MPVPVNFSLNFQISERGGARGGESMFGLDDKGEHE